MKQTKRWIAVSYLAAVILWVILCVSSLVRGAWYESQGLRLHQELAWQDLSVQSMEPIETGKEGFWYVSTDGDPQIHWTGNAYLETVELDVLHTTPGLSVVLYWREPGQADFSSRQSVYAVQTEQGKYRFDLGGKQVEEIRIDPDSVGGVITRFDGVELNPAKPWYEAFKPTTTGMVLFAVLPLAAAAAVWEGCSILKTLSFKKEK